MSKTPPYYVVRHEIMKEMHWDYWTYRKQPWWVIRDILRAKSAESLAQKHLAKRAEK